MAVRIHTFLFLLCYVSHVVVSFRMLGCTYPFSGCKNERIFGKFKESTTSLDHLTVNKVSLPFGLDNSSEPVNRFVTKLENLVINTKPSRTFCLNAFASIKHLIRHNRVDHSNSCTLLWCMGKLDHRLRKLDLPVFLQLMNNFIYGSSSDKYFYRGFGGISNIGVNFKLLSTKAHNALQLTVQQLLYKKNTDPKDVAFIIYR